MRPSISSARQSSQLANLFPFRACYCADLLPVSMRQLLRVVACRMLPVPIVSVRRVLETLWLLCSTVKAENLGCLSRRFMSTFRANTSGGHFASRRNKLRNHVKLFDFSSVREHHPGKDPEPCTDEERI